MAANTTPIFPKAANVGWSGPMTAANTAMDGTGTVETIFTAGADGGRCDEIRLKPLGTNVATVARIFLNNGGSNATPSNNVLWDEVTLGATTASNSLGLPTYSLQGPKSLPAGYKINVCLGTAVAAGWIASASGGDY